MNCEVGALIKKKEFLKVILILFGGKKIPEFMKGLGKGINSFKKGLNDIEEDIKADPSDNKTTGDK